MRFGFSALAAAVLSSFRGLTNLVIPSLPVWATVPTGGSRGVSKKIRLGGRRYFPNGAREVSRRLRQIAEGRLTASNGVV